MKSLGKIHLIICGLVQGVGFRYHTQQKAREMGLVGWVKNLPDGTVETYAEGTEETLQRFASWCAQGPAHSRVEDVLEKARGPIEALSFREFDIRR